MVPTRLPRRALALGPVASLVFASVLSGCLWGSAPAQSEPSIEPASEAAENQSRSAQQDSKNNLWGGPAVWPGTYGYDAKRNHSLVLKPGSLVRGPDQVLRLNSSVDGQPIQIGLIRPIVATGTRLPVIAVGSPYFRDLTAGPLDASHTNNPKHIVSFLATNYVPHGYAIALIPVRGTGGSGGCFEWWSAAERKDLGQAVEWLGAQPWSNGNVGMIGLSLSGAAAWEAAGTGVPALKTIVPVASETDFYSWFVRNGTSAVFAGPLGTTAFYGFYSTSPFHADPFVGREEDRVAAAAVCPGVAQGAAGSLFMAATGQVDPAEYAAARDLRKDVVAKYDGSVFLVHGLHDWLAHPHLVYPWIGALEAKGLAVKHLIGQWRHRMPDDRSGGAYYNPNVRLDFAESLLRWFDHWLKDQPGPLGPRVQIADSAGSWRNEEAWPPSDAPWRPYYLTAQRGLAGTPQTATATETILADPWRSLTSFEGFGGQNPPACQQCIRFTGPEVAEDTRIAGLPQFHARVTPTGPGGTLTAHLYIAQGTLVKRVGWATMDLRYASGSASPAVVRPGEPLIAKMEFEPLDLLVPKGARLVLEVFGGGYGEPAETYRQTQALAPAAYYRSSQPTYPIQLHVGADASVLRWMEFGRPPGALFEPPALPG